MKVLLVALNAKFIHTSLALRDIKNYCIPYSNSIELLETSINQKENDILKIIYKKQPDIIGLSCYIWNMSYIKSLLPTLRKILPTTTLILGGPEVSYDSMELLKTLEADIIIYGEGEKAWKTYLDHRFSHQLDLKDIKGITYRDNLGQIHQNKPQEPLDLNELPFPYHDFNSLKHKILYYEASRGCPFNCQYCLSSIEKGIRFVSIEKVKEHMQYFLNQQVKQVKFVDRTFNANKRYAIEIWQYLITHDNGYTNFHFEIAAELMTEEMFDVLSKARKGLIQFEIGVQSTNLEVLKCIKRPMPFEDIKKVVSRIQSLGNIHQHLDLIAGLPLEDYASFKQSFNDVLSLKPEQFQLGFLKLLKGSGLRQKAKEYGLVYKSEPPYEILYTSSISYFEILQLHMIDELIDKYYNTGQFNYTLDYFFKFFKQPFDFFEKFAEFWEEKGYDLIEHNKLAYSYHLIEFATDYIPIQEEIIKETIRLDYLLREPIKEMPPQFETMDRASLKENWNLLLKDDYWIKCYMPHLLQYPPRQRYRLTYLDAFHYTIWQKDLPIKHLKEKQIILFDYSTYPSQFKLIEKEVKL